jgi:Cu/Ag efflux protein CusF
MTQTVQDHPHTALDLLLGPDDESPEALAHQILSAASGVNLGRALENLPKTTYDAAVREVTAATTGLLNVDLIRMLVAGWRKHHDLTAAAWHTLAAPGSIELVDLATHQVTTTQHPSVTVLVDGHRVASLQLSLSVVFTISALTAKISAGRLAALHPGRCDVTVTLAIQETNVITRQARLELPGVIPFRPGTRLLAAHHYPTDAARAENADYPAQQIAPAPEEAAQQSPIPRGPQPKMPFQRRQP